LFKVFHGANLQHQDIKQRLVIFVGPQMVCIIYSPIEIFLTGCVKIDVCTCIFAQNYFHTIMKRIFLFLAAGSFAFASCQNAPEADKAQATDAVTVDTNAAKGSSYKADLAQSVVEWVGTKPTGKHNGTLSLKEGNIAVENNAITGGKFVIDINSLKALDQDSTGNAKLAGHLASPDFFDAAKFPEATFEIATVAVGVDTTGGHKIILQDATHTITGNLTLKGVTKSISFPAKVALTETSVTTDADFNIDRTQWGLSYGADKGLKDKMIHADVNLKLHIVATK